MEADGIDKSQIPKYSITFLLTFAQLAEKRANILQRSWLTIGDSQEEGIIKTGFFVKCMPCKYLDVVITNGGQ